MGDRPYFVSFTIFMFVLFLIGLWFARRERLEHRRKLEEEQRKKG
jgi:cbb3-type cytochrome oxidase subunit 3